MFPGSFRADDLAEASRGRFRAPHLLSAGSTAAVFHAFDVSLDREVAVKVAHGTLETNHCLREEHRLLTGPLAAIAEPGRDQTLCRCYGLLELEGRVALVLEYLDPQRYEPLDRFVQRTGPLGEYETLEVLVPFFTLLAAAHEQGLIYNDAGQDKAGHLLWDPTARQLKVIDWANIIDATRASSTQARRPYHDVVGCGELLHFLRTGALAPEPPTPDELQALGPMGEIIRRCLDFADSNGFQTARPLEQAARARLDEIEVQFHAQAGALADLFDHGRPQDDFEAARAGLDQLRSLLPRHPLIPELDARLRAWTAAMTAASLLQQAETELREGQPSAAQKLRLVLNLLRANPSLALARDHSSLQLLLALATVQHEHPQLLPPRAVETVLEAGPEQLPAVASDLLRQLLDHPEMAAAREADLGFGLETLSALAASAHVPLWTAAIRALPAASRRRGERLEALDELRRGLDQLAKLHPRDDVWRDLVGCYEGFLEELRPFHAEDPQGLAELMGAVQRAHALAQTARNLWAEGAFREAAATLDQLRQADAESRAAVAWKHDAQQVAARWGFPADQASAPTALAWLLTEGSPAAVVFLLRDALTELDAWARPGTVGRDASAGAPGYLESLRLILETFLRAFEFLGVPRQRHPAQRLTLRALVQCFDELENVESVRGLGQALRSADRDEVAWQLANESVQLYQAIEQRRREQPALRRLVGAQSLQETANTQLIEVLGRLTISGASLPLLGLLARLPETRYQAALAYCEQGDLEAARVVLGDLQVVGARSAETIVRATCLHRVVSLAQAAANDVQQGRLAEAEAELEQALHEVDAHPSFRPEFRGVVQLLKDRKAQVARAGPGSKSPVRSAR